MRKWKVGLYINWQWPTFEAILDHPASFEEYVRKLGLNVAIISSNTKISSKGVESPYLTVRETSCVAPPPPAIQDLNPFPDELKGSFGPGARFDADDGNLRKLIGLLHSMGIDCWLTTTGWYLSGADLAPQLMAIDLRGRRTDRLPQTQYGWEMGNMFCPSNESVNAWYGAYLSYLITAYEIDGIFFTHSRYPSPANLAMLFACGCNSCARLAVELGYDFEEFRRTISLLETGLKLESFPLLTRDPLSIADWIEVRDIAPGILTWLEFRARVLSRNIRRLSDVVHGVKRNVTFAIQTLSPSLGPYIGHRYSDFATYVDFTIPILSWIQPTALNFAAALAEVMTAKSKRMKEEDAIKLAYWLLGWTTISGLPTNIASLGLSRGNTTFALSRAHEDLLALEIRRTRWISRHGKCIVGLRGTPAWPKESVERLSRLSADEECDGVVFHGYELPIT